MNPNLQNILRWLAIIPAFLVGSGVSLIVFNILSIPIDVQLMRDLNNSSDLAGHWITAPIFLISKHFLQGFCGGYASIWVAPDKNRKIVFNIIFIIISLFSLLVILAKILVPIFWEELVTWTLGESIRHSLEIFPNALGILIGSYMASRLPIQNVSAENDSI